MIQASIQKELPGFTLSVDFEAAVGVTVLFGASGAGKTLTLECVAGFAKPDDGCIRLNGRTLFEGKGETNVRPQLRSCGYVFQDHALFPHMTVRQNVAFAAAQTDVDDLLRRFRITDVADKYPNQISGGQGQRCSIARALIANPGMLLLDEPSRGLDALLRAELYDVVRQVQSDYKLPILLVTHDVEEALTLGERMLCYESGRIVQAGTPKSVIDQPANSHMATLFGK